MSTVNISRGREETGTERQKDSRLGGRGRRDNSTHTRQRKKTRNTEQEEERELYYISEWCDDEGRGGGEDEGDTHRTRPAPPPLCSPVHQRIQLHTETYYDCHGLLCD